MKRLYLIFVLVLNTLLVFGQNTEQLQQIIAKKRVSDTTRVGAYIRLSRIVEKNNPDSALKLLNIAEDYALDALANVKRAGYKEKLRQQLAEIYREQARIQMQKQNYGIALFLLKKSLEIYLEQNDTANLASVEYDIATIYDSFDKTGLAKKYYEQSLKHSVRDSIRYARTLEKLAGIYKSQGQLRKATEFLTKSYSIVKSLDSQKAAGLLVDLADLSKQLGDTAAAKQLLQKSLEINLKLNQKPGLFDVLISIGEIYLNQNQKDSAFQYFMMAYNVANGLGPAYQAKAQYYIAKVYMDKNLDRAEQIAEKGFRFAEFEHDTLTMIRLADLLKEINLKQGNCPRALRYLNIKSKLETQYLKSQTQKQINKLKQESSLREQLAIDSLSSILQREQQLRSQQQDKFKQTLSLGLLFIVFLLLFIILLSLRHKRTVENLQTQLEQNPHIRDLLEKLTTHQQQLQEHKQQIKSLLSQFDIDFNNAQKLIRTVLPPDDILSSAVKEYFKIYIARQEISGDFYWWTKTGDDLYIAVGDTTGKGISGALIGILSIHLLNQAVLKQNMTDPSQILGFVRMGIIRNLEQHHPVAHNDTVNMSLVRIHLQTLSLAFAGAKQSIYIIPGQPVEIDQAIEKKIRKHHHKDVTLIELRPDLMPLGLFVKMHEFETLNLKIPADTRIYLFTDGFANQFGGEFDEKFGRRKFRHLIMENAHKPMSEQKVILEQTFRQWKGEHDQTDDVTVIGIKL